jgi:hypothetical protein
VCPSLIRIASIHSGSRVYGTCQTNAMNRFLKRQKRLWHTGSFAKGPTPSRISPIEIKTILLERRPELSHTRIITCTSTQQLSISLGECKTIGLESTTNVFPLRQAISPGPPTPRRFIFSDREERKWPSIYTT